ncbi:hypothetical protein ACWCPJ_31540 [Streptomyces collinus]
MSLGIPLPHRRNPDTRGAPGLTGSAEASWLLADLARAGWPATALAEHLDVNGAQERRGAAAQIRRRPWRSQRRLSYDPWELYLSQPAPSDAS